MSIFFDSIGGRLSNRHAVWLLLLLVLLVMPRVSLAQNTPERLSRLELQLWPDFDRTSVLATLIGVLGEDVSGPTAITIPVPQGATIHVVAPLGADMRPGPEMEYDDSVQGQVTFTAEPPGFWLEYYYPYEAEGDRRDFTFTWQSDIAVDELEASVQQPSMASDMTTEPAAIVVTSGLYDLMYHQLPTRAVPAGTTYTLAGTYTMVSPVLSAEILAEQEDLLPADLTPVPEAEEGFNWPIALAVSGGVLALAAVAWLVVTNRQQNRRVMKPRPASRSDDRSARKTRPPIPKKPASAIQFCHQCGQPVEPDDKFCRNCGTAVRMVRNQ